MHLMDSWSLLSDRVTVCGLDVRVDVLLGACEAASLLLTKKLFSQLEGIGQEFSSFPGALFPPPPVELCPTQGQVPL